MMPNHYRVFTSSISMKDFVTTRTWEAIFHFGWDAEQEKERQLAKGNYPQIIEEDCQCELLPYILAEFMELKWISVDEKLPEKNQDCIVLTIHSPNARVYKFNQGKFYGWGKEDSCVTHWIALPDRPEPTLEIEHS